MILGACNPPLAYRALSAEIDIGLLLPCNVIVYEQSLGESVVAVIDPVAMIAFIGNQAVRAVADEARTKLLRVLESVAGTAGL